MLVAASSKVQPEQLNAQQQGWEQRQKATEIAWQPRPSFLAI
jgi:hypothetical protein